MNFVKQKISNYTASAKLMYFTIQSILVVASEALRPKVVAICGSRSIRPTVTHLSFKLLGHEVRGLNALGANTLEKYK